MNSIMNTIYNQYLTTYAPKKSDTRYDTHKRSELKSIYNSMAKINRDAPLYKFDDNETVRKTVVGIKEDARELHNSIVSIIGASTSKKDMGKIAYSSNENIIRAKYIDTPENEVLTTSKEIDDNVQNDSTVVSTKGEIPSYEIEVLSLAQPQVNLGKYLPSDAPALTPNTYSFDVTVNGQGYEFQFSINEGDTNKDVQERLSRLINHSGIHLLSSVEEDGKGNSALRIQSSQVGVTFGQDTKVFSISENNSEHASGTVSYLGIDYMAREATNAKLIVNGMEASSSSNSFTLGKNFEISLNGISPNEGETVTIGVKPDTEAIVEHISKLTESYNRFIQSATDYQTSQPRGMNLVNEMKGITNVFRENLSQIGVNAQEDGTLLLDKEQLSKTAISEDSDERLSFVRDYSTAMIRKSNQVSLNPISYVNKTVVAYKNPGKSYTSPYVASAYAGILFNNYC